MNLKKSEICHSEPFGNAQDDTLKFNVFMRSSFFFEKGFF